MKRYVRLMFWLTVIGVTLFVGSHTVDAKMAFIERRGDHVRVTYQYSDNYRLEVYEPPCRKDYRVLHEHFHFRPNYYSYGFRGNSFRFYQSYRYPVYFNPFYFR